MGMESIIQYSIDTPKLQVTGIPISLLNKLTLQSLCSKYYFSLDEPIIVFKSDYMDYTFFTNCWSAEKF